MISDKQHSIYTHFSKDVFAKSARRLKLQRPRAEDVLVESYFVQNILVTW